MPIRKQEKRKLKGIHLKKKSNQKTVKKMWDDLTEKEKIELITYYEKEIKEWDL
jgi:hypothetical protein